MKKLIKRTLITCMTSMLLAGCAGSSSVKETAGSNEKDLLARIKEKGEVVIAMEGNWAPWTYEDESGKLTGFEVEVSTAVAETLRECGALKNIPESSQMSLFSF